MGCGTYRCNKCCLQFFQSGELLKAVNCTAITLIPNVPNPSYVKDYQPITCYSTIYKLIEKLLTAKLKTVLDFLIGPSQSAFIEGRKLLDNVIIAHKLIKGYSQNGVSPRSLIKIDTRNAHDSLEWPFLRTILLDFGLPQKFVELVMMCVTSVSSSILMNGGLTSSSKQKRGYGKEMLCSLICLFWQWSILIDLSNILNLTLSLSITQGVTNCNYYIFASLVISFYTAGLRNCLSSL